MDSQPFSFQLLLPFQSYSLMAQALFSNKRPDYNKTLVWLALICHIDDETFSL